jgi:hypothetical protein
MTDVWNVTMLLLTNRGTKGARMTTEARVHSAVPFETASFDAALCSLCMPYLVQPRAVIAEVPQAKAHAPIFD